MDGPSEDPVWVLQCGLKVRADADSRFIFLGKFDFTVESILRYISAEDKTVGCVCEKYNLNFYRPIK